MKLNLILVGKTFSPEVKLICNDYFTRVSRYVKTEETVIESNAQKLTDRKKAMEKEGELILKKIAPTDFVILLDERGKEYGSVQFANYLETLFNHGHKKICFVVGGAYGFSEEVYLRANAKLSLSKMTFSHQIIRAIFLEQLYRAFTIINKEPYHHE